MLPIHRRHACLAGPEPVKESPSDIGATSKEKNNIVIPEFSAWLTLVLEQCRAENIRNLPRQRAPTPLFPERRPREACSMPISGCHDLPLATFNLPSRVFRHGCRRAECPKRRWEDSFTRSPPAKTCSRNRHQNKTQQHPNRRHSGIPRPLAPPQKPNSLVLPAHRPTHAPATAIRIKRNPPSSFRNFHSAQRSENIRNLRRKAGWPSHRSSGGILHMLWSDGRGLMRFYLKPALN